MKLITKTDLATAAGKVGFLIDSFKINNKVYGENSQITDTMAKAAEKAFSILQAAYTQEEPIEGESE